MKVTASETKSFCLSESDSSDDEACDSPPNSSKMINEWIYYNLNAIPENDLAYISCVLVFSKSDSHGIKYESRKKLIDIYHFWKAGIPKIVPQSITFTHKWLDMM